MKHTINVNTNNSENNLMELLQANKPMSSRPQGTPGQLHRLHLKGPVTDPEHYVEWVELIRDATEADTIEFHINSPGGNVYSAIELLHAFADCEAHIHVVLSGIVASAGTILMTVGDSFEINPWTTFMFHNYSGGTIGKGNEMAIKLEYEREWSKRFMHEVYEGLLTPAEVDQLLDGRDFWLPAEDVGKRLGDMIEYRQKIASEMLADILEDHLGEQLDLDSMSKKELLKVAEDKGIKPAKSWNKEKLIKEIKGE